MSAHPSPRSQDNTQEDLRISDLKDSLRDALEADTGSMERVNGKQDYARDLVSSALSSKSINPQELRSLVKSVFDESGDKDSTAVTDYQAFFDSICSDLIGEHEDSPSSAIEGTLLEDLALVRTWTDRHLKMFRLRCAVMGDCFPTEEDAFQGYLDGLGEGISLEFFGELVDHLGEHATSLSVETRSNFLKSLVRPGIYIDYDSSQVTIGNVSLDLPGWTESEVKDFLDSVEKFLSEPEPVKDVFEEFSEDLPEEPKNEKLERQKNQAVAFFRRPSVLKAFGLSGASLKKCYDFVDYFHMNRPDDFQKLITGLDRWSIGMVEKKVIDNKHQYAGFIRSFESQYEGGDSEGAVVNETAQVNDVFSVLTDQFDGKVIHYDGTLNLDEATQLVQNPKVKAFVRSLVALKSLDSGNYDDLGDVLEVSLLKQIAALPAGMTLLPNSGSLRNVNNLTFEENPDISGQGDLLLSVGNWATDIDTFDQMEAVLVGRNFENSEPEQDVQEEQAPKSLIEKGKDSVGLVTTWKNQELKDLYLKYVVIEDCFPTGESEFKDYIDSLGDDAKDVLLSLAPQFEALAAKGVDLTKETFAKLYNVLAHYSGSITYGKDSWGFAIKKGMVFLPSLTNKSVDVFLKRIAVLGGVVPGDSSPEAVDETVEMVETAREVARVFFKDLMQELKDDPVMKDMVEKAGGPDVSYEEALDIFLEISLTSNFDQQILGIALMLKSSDVVADLDPKALQVGIDDILLRLKDGKGIGLIPTGDGRNVSLSKESMRRILTKYPPLALSLSVILKKNPKIDLAAAMKILVESTRAEAGETLPVSSEKPVSTADKPESPAAAVVRPRISPERKEQLRLRREAAKKIALGIPALLLPIRADLEAAFNAKAASKGKPKTDINWNEIFNSVNIELQKNLNPSETAHLPDSNDLGDLIRDTFLAEQGGGVKAFFEMIGETLTGKKKVDFLEQEIYKSLHTSTFEQLYESNHSVLIVTYGPRDGEGPKIYARIQDKKTEKRVTVPSAKKMATIKDPQRIEEIKNEINRREGLYETMNLKDPVTIHDKYKTFVESGGQLEYGEWKGEAESSFSMEEKILSRFGPLINMLKIMMAFMSGKPEQLEAILKNEGTKPEFVENNTEQVAIWQEHGEKIDTERKNIAAWEDLLDDDPKKVLLGKVQAYVDVSEKTVHPNEVEEALVEKGKELIPVLKTKDLKINLTGKISLDGFKSLLKAEVSVSDNKEVLINGHVLAEWTDDALDLILDKDADYDPESEGDPADAIDAAGLSPKQVQAKLSVIGELLVGVKLPGMDGIMVGDKEYSIAAAGKVYQSASTSGSSSWSEVDEEALTKQVVESLEPFASDSNIIRMTSFFQKLGDGGASLSKNGEYIPLNLLQAVSGLSPTAYRTLSFDSAWFGGNAKVNFNDETERVNSYSDITRLLGVSEGRV